MVLFALCLLILDQGQFESYLEMTNFKIGLYNKIYGSCVLYSLLLVCKF